MKSSVNQPKKDDDESVIEPPREGEVEEQRILAPNQANSSTIASKVPGMTHVKQDEDELWARKMNNATKSDDDVPTPTKDAGGGAIASKVPGVTYVKQDEGINETHSALRPSTDAFDNDPSTLQTPKISAPIKLLSKMKTGKKLYKNMGMFRNNNRQGVAWKKREAEKIRDDTLDMFPSVDPDDFQIEEPPFPYAEDQHPQVNNQTEEPPSPHREDEGSERPHTGNHMEEPPVTLGNDTVPSTVTFEVPDAQIPLDDLPTADTINANDIIVPEAVCVEPPVQAEAVETMASKPEFVLLRKQNRLLLIVGVVIIVGLMTLIFTTSDLFLKKKTPTPDTVDAVPIPSLQQTPAPFLTLSPLMLPTLSPLVHPAVLTLPPSEETPTPLSTITSVEPTLVPSMQHQVKPSMRPTMAQSTHPTGKHSMQPSITKSMEPTMVPSSSMQPTLKASMEPSKIPSLQPTFMPSLRPTVNPSMQPITAVEASFIMIISSFMPNLQVSRGIGQQQALDWLVDNVIVDDFKEKEDLLLECFIMILFRRDVLGQNMNYVKSCDHCEIRGVICTEEKVEKLNFNGFTKQNKLTGVMPTELGNLQALTSLHLGNHQLTGAVPSELGHLQGMTDLYLYVNDFTGSTPLEFANLQALEYLYLFKYD